MHEDDLRWVGNFALGIAFFVAIMGVTFSQHLKEEHRCYAMVMFVLLGGAFAIVGGFVHWLLWKKIQATTIRRWEDEENDRLQTMWRRFRRDNGDD